MTKIESKLVTGWDSQDIVKLVLKQGDKTVLKELANIHWYFSIKKDDYLKIGGKQFFIQFNTETNSSHIYNITEKEEFVLIYCKSTSKHPVTEKLLTALTTHDVELFEADLSRTKRYLVDRLAPIADNLSILYFDIETDDSGEGISVGRDRILSWAAYNNNGQKWFLCLDDEKKLLAELVKVIDKHDVFTGWNSTKFDVPYVQARMTKYKMHYAWRKKIHVDMMQRCIKVYSYDMDKIGLTGFSLNEFARVFLNSKKVEHKESMLEMFDSNRELLKKYNLQDVKILYDLDKKLNIIDLMIKSCVLTGATLDRFYVGELLDMYMLRRAKEFNTHLYTRPTREEAAANALISIIGGFVMKPITGLYTGVRVLDFKSLYPSIMISWNISPDSLDREKSKKGDIALNEFVEEYTKIENVDFMTWHKFLMQQKTILDPDDTCFQTANNNFFKKNIAGFIPLLVKELLENRVAFKDKMKLYKPGTAEYGNARSSQATIKELCNSMYGVTADRNSRYFNKNVAESITLTGQYLNKAVSAISEKVGYPSIYGDTDSIFVPIPTEDDPEKINDEIDAKLKEYMLKYFKLSTYTVQLEYEKAYRKMIMVDKKRYTGILNWVEGDDTEMIYSKGLEDIKKNTIRITKLKMRELIVMITKDDKTLPEVIVWLEKLRKYVFESDKITVKDICITTRLSKPTFKYKSKSAHVFLAEELIKQNRLQQPSDSENSWGTRLTYVIKSTTPSQKAVHIDDFDGVWDKNYYWDIQIYAPMMRMLQVIWPEEDWKKYSTIELAKRKRKLAIEEKKKEYEKQKAIRVKEREKRKIARERIAKEKEKARAIRKKEQEEKKKEREKLAVIRAEKKKEREVIRQQRLEEKEIRQKEREEKKKEREKLKKEKELKQQKLKLK